MGTDEFEICEHLQRMLKDGHSEFRTTQRHQASLSSVPETTKVGASSNPSIASAIVADSDNNNIISSETTLEQDTSTIATFPTVAANNVEYPLSDNETDGNNLSLMKIIHQGSVAHTTK